MPSDPRILEGELKQHTLMLLSNLNDDLDDHFAKWLAPNVGFMTYFIECHQTAVKARVDTLTDDAELLTDRCSYSCRDIATGRLLPPST